MRLPNTVNVFCGRQLAGKMKEDIMKEVLGQMGGAASIRAVQVGYEIIQVTFSSPAANKPTLRRRFNSLTSGALFRGVVLLQPLCMFLISPLRGLMILSRSP